MEPVPKTAGAIPQSYPLLTATHPTTAAASATTKKALNSKRTRVVRRPREPTGGVGVAFICKAFHNFQALNP